MVGGMTKMKDIFNWMNAWITTWSKRINQIPLLNIDLVPILSGIYPNPKRG